MQFVLKYLSIYLIRQVVGGGIWLDYNVGICFLVISFEFEVFVYMPLTTMYTVLICFRIITVVTSFTDQNVYHEYIVNILYINILRINIRWICQVVFH